MRTLALLLLVAGCSDATLREETLATDSTLVEEWARTHCERRWSECPHYPSDHEAAYILSCETVAMAVTCDIDEEGNWLCPDPLHPVTECLEEIVLAECSTLGALPSCNPWKL